MRTILASWVLMALFGGASPARADATADGRAVSEAFEKAVAAGNPQAVLALYRDDASVIWPGQGEEGKGKAVIEKLARGFLADMKGARLCPQVTDEHLARRRLHRQPRPREQTSTSPASKPTSVEIRTSEVLAKTDGKWLYLKAAPKPRRARRER